ncbi:hypothetical protein ACFL02_07845 [Planctomycetota bacterium]
MEAIKPINEILQVVPKSDFDLQLELAEFHAEANQSMRKKYDELFAKAGNLCAQLREKDDEINRLKQRYKLLTQAVGLDNQCPG